MNRPASGPATAGTLVSIVFIAAAAMDCSHGGHSHSAPVPYFTCAGGVLPAADQVAMNCPATESGMLEVTVNLGGPTTSYDIYGIKFDVVFDPTVLTFRPPAHEGIFWRGTTPVLAAAVSPGDPGRIVAAITLTGSTPGGGSSQPTVAVMDFVFGPAGIGTTHVTLENGEAVDSSLAPIASIQFSSASLSVTYQ
jgi:hypothetical protein